MQPLTLTEISKKKPFSSILTYQNHYSQEWHHYFIDFDGWWVMEFPDMLVPLSVQESYNIVALQILNISLCHTGLLNTAFALA